MSAPSLSQIWLARAISIGALIIIVLLLGTYYYTRPSGNPLTIDPGDAKLVARGRVLYEKSCASCHGAKLEGQPEWQTRLSNGRLPAPPHDDAGHTWHHTDQVLFDITRHGLVPPHAPAGYQSDMPAFKSILSDDEIRAALAYIKNHWSAKVMQWRSEALKHVRQP
jgi:S-disulfanyl-L-cysteine oxidoreductase SoxD